jgi:hypothetical protein
VYKKLQMIVVDEVSMVRADLLDCVDRFLRLHGPRPHRPFGGVQMAFFGDLYQLPPVVTGPERKALEAVYETPYFYSARALQEVDLELVELEKVYRQTDRDFLEVLGAIRNGDGGGRAPGPAQHPLPAGVRTRPRGAVRATDHHQPTRPGGEPSAAPEAPRQARPLRRCAPG